MGKLLPPKNKRFIYPRTCNHCRYMLYNEGVAFCRRDGLPIGECQGDEHVMTCDRWTSPDISRHCDNGHEWQYFDYVGDDICIHCHKSKQSLG